MFLRLLRGVNLPKRMYFTVFSGSYGEKWVRENSFDIRYYE